MTLKNVDSLGFLSKMLEENHGDALREMLAETLRQYMEAEASALCGADYGERSGSRENSRNGYRPRPFETRLGTMDLMIPKLREKSYLPSFLTARRRWEQAFVSVVAEAYVCGVSTRKVEELVEAMGAKGMSKSEVSRMASSLDEEVNAFRERRFEKAFPYIWLDALYIKVREGGRVTSKAVLVALGVNEDGDREVLGMSVANSEMEASWRAFLRDLISRGMRGVQIAISDAHEGLRAAIRATLNATTWQRCYVHFIRNVLGAVNKAAQGFVAAALRNVFQQTTEVHAREAMSKAIELLEAKYPKAAAIVREAEDDVLAYFAFPEAHRRQIRSTNPLERLNKELRRRVRVVGIFPTEASVYRLVGMLLIEQGDEWAVSRRYFSTNSMASLRTEVPALEDAAQVAK
jgi:transposase-like protein